MLLQKGDKIAITGCSNAQPLSNKIKVDSLLAVIQELGLHPISSSYLYEKHSVFGGTAKERAQELHRFYGDNEIKAVFDISGGNIANEILEALDFDLIKSNPKPFFGYSDLTVIINAIYARTGISSYLYQIRNLIRRHKEQQIKWFLNSILGGGKELFEFDYTFLQGSRMEGVVTGGNVRCLLKLAGTPYMPDFKGKILFLEAYSGDAALITACMSQLKQMGVFRDVNGILLGTFTKMEERQEIPAAEEIVIRLINNPDLPVARTREIGHGSDSKCIIIGKESLFIR